MLHMCVSGPFNRQEEAS